MRSCHRRVEAQEHRPAGGVASELAAMQAEEHRQAASAVLHDFAGVCAWGGVSIIHAVFGILALIWRFNRHVLLSNMSALKPH